MNATFDSPLGPLALSGEFCPGTDELTLTSVSFATSPASVESVPAEFEETVRQFREYFSGDRRAFDLPISAAGTPFQQRVWAMLDEIPYGSSLSYGKIAEKLGAPRDRIRAVAAAIGANALLIIRPCHRVIGANGALTGYAGGVARKQTLLALEGALEPILV